MFVYCNNSPTFLSDPCGYAAGRSLLSYDKGGGYFFFCNESEDPEVSSLIEHTKNKAINRWGATPPATAVIICRPTYETINESVIKDFMEDMLVAGVAEILVLGVISLVTGVPAYEISAYKNIAPLTFIAGFLLPDALGTSLPAGEYNVYAVTIIERYRSVDPSTGMFKGWQCVTTTEYYVNCGQWIGITDRWG